MLLKSTAKNNSQDYECSLPKNDARVSFFYYSFLGAGLLMSFHRHSCPSIMIIGFQLQTCVKRTAVLLVPSSSVLFFPCSVVKVVKETAPNCLLFYIYYLLFYLSLGFIS